MGNMVSNTPSNGAPAPSKQKSKAYLSSVAIQSDAIKYRQKYKELKRKVHEIEQVCLFIGSTYLQENDKLQALTLRIKGNIQRLRLERAILYERLEADVRNVPVASSPAGAQNQASSSPSSSNQVNASKEQDSESTHKEVDDMGVSVDIEDTL